MKRFWAGLKKHWHHLALGIAGGLAIVETQWSALGAYFGAWGPIILAVVSVLRYALNFWAAMRKEPVDDSPSVD